MIFLGIDGGGTRCRARLRDAAGHLLGEGEGGPANIHQDFEGTVRSISEATRQAMNAGNLSDEIAPTIRAGFGLAGIVTAGTGDRLGAAGLPFAAIKAINDAHAACLGAHGGADGGIIITGTGSAGYLIKAGSGKGVGGWGFELGDDGSGAIIGRAAVRRAVLALDGLGAASRLTEAVLADLGRDQPALARWARAARPGDYARFAPSVLTAAEGGDAIAQEVLDSAVASLATMAARLLALGAPRLSMLGGLAAALRLRMPALIQEYIVPPAADAMDGAIMVARLAAGLPVRPSSLGVPNG